MTWDNLRDHVLQTVAAAAFLGGGSLVVGNSIDVAKHDTRLERLERVDERLDSIQRDVAQTRETVARLEAKAEK
jgi:uncharacterized protein (DUF342 family)